MPFRPIMIAVGGDSGTGKTSLCSGINDIFGSASIATIGLADYHSLDRSQRKMVGLLALDPRANNFAAMEEDLWTLRDGRAIEKPFYDHSVGRFKGTERVSPREIVVVHGLFPLYTRALRSLFDVSVWVDPEPEIKLAWKMERDTVQRGYTEEEVRAELAERSGALERYIAPQAKYADLIVTFFRAPSWFADRDPAKFSARIRKGGRLRPLDYAEFASPNTHIRHLERMGGGGYPETVIEIDGDISAEAAAEVEEKLWSFMGLRANARRERLGLFKDAAGETRVSHPLALTQLLIARRIVLIENERMEMVP
jgi:phosphoribulokinase